MTNYEPGKQARMDLIRKKYVELKGKRNELRSIHMKMIEDELEGFKKDFADLVQDIYEDEATGYKVTVADIMHAMGTTSRNTVHEYLKDARERKLNRFINGIETATFSIESIEEYESHNTFDVVVFDAASETRTLFSHETGKWYVAMHEWDPKYDAWSQKKTQLDLPFERSNAKIPEGGWWLSAQPEFQALMEKYPA